MSAFSSSFSCHGLCASSFPLPPAAPPPPLPPARRPSLPQPSRVFAFSQRSQSVSQEADGGDDFPDFQSPSPVDLAAVSRQQTLLQPAACCSSPPAAAAAAASQAGSSPPHWSSPPASASPAPAQAAAWQACDDEPPLLPVRKRASCGSLSGSQPPAPPPFVSKYKAIPSKPLLKLRQRCSSTTAAAQQGPQQQQPPFFPANAGTAQPQLVSPSLYAAATQAGAAPRLSASLPLSFPALLVQDGGVLEAAQPPALSASAASSLYPPPGLPFAQYAQCLPLQPPLFPLFPLPFSSLPASPQPQPFQQKQRRAGQRAQPLPAPFPPSAFETSRRSHSATASGSSASDEAEDAADGGCAARDAAATAGEARAQRPSSLRQAARWGGKMLQAVDDYDALYRRLQQLTAGQWTDADLDAQMSRVQCEKLFNAHGWTCTASSKAELISRLREWLHRGWLRTPHEVRTAAQGQAGKRKRKRRRRSSSSSNNNNNNNSSCSKHSLRTAAAAPTQERPTTGGKEPRVELSRAAQSQQRSRGSSSQRVKKERQRERHSTARDSSGNSGSVGSVSPGDERQSDSDYEPQADAAARGRSISCSSPQTDSEDEGKERRGEGATKRRERRAIAASTAAAQPSASTPSATGSPCSPPTAPSAAAAAAGSASSTASAAVQAADSQAEDEQKDECGLSSCRSFMLKPDDSVAICVEEYALFLRSHSRNLRSVNTTRYTACKELKYAAQPAGGVLAAARFHSAERLQRTARLDGSVWLVLRFTCDGVETPTSSAVATSSAARTRTKTETAATRHAARPPSPAPAAAAAAGSTWSPSSSGRRLSRFEAESLEEQRLLAMSRASGMVLTRRRNPSSVVHSFEQRAQQRLRQGQKLDRWLQKPRKRGLIILSPPLQTNATLAPAATAAVDTAASPPAADGDLSAEQQQQQEEEDEEAEDEDVNTTVGGGLIGILYQQQPTEDGDGHSDDGNTVQAATTGQRAMHRPSSAPLRCRCSYLLPASLYQSSIARHWKVGDFFTTRSQSGARTGRIIDVDGGSRSSEGQRRPSLHRCLRVLWYTAVDVELEGGVVQQTLHHDSSRRQQRQRRVYRCHAIDMCEQTPAAVSPWEMTVCAYPPQRFPSTCPDRRVNSGSQHAAQQLLSSVSCLEPSVQPLQSGLISRLLHRVHHELLAHLHLPVRQQQQEQELAVAVQAMLRDFALLCLQLQQRLLLNVSYCLKQLHACLNRLRQDAPVSAALLAAARRLMHEVVTEWKESGGAMEEAEGWAEQDGEEQRDTGRIFSSLQEARGCCDC